MHCYLHRACGCCAPQGWELRLLDHDEEDGNDSSRSSNTWTFPPDTSIAPNAYLVIYASGARELGVRQPPNTANPLLLSTSLKLQPLYCACVQASFGTCSSLRGSMPQARTSQLVTPPPGQPLRRRRCTRASSCRRRAVWVCSCWGQAASWWNECSCPGAQAAQQVFRSAGEVCAVRACCAGLCGCSRCVRPPSPHASLPPYLHLWACIPPSVRPAAPRVRRPRWQVRLRATI